MRLKFSILTGNNPDAPQKNTLDVENFRGYPPSGSPAAVAEAVY